MNRQVTAIVLIGAFILLTLCCWGFFMLKSDHGMAMDGMVEHALNYNELINGVSVSVLPALLLLLLLGVLAFTLSSDMPLEHRVSIRRVIKGVEPLFWRPFQLAFSDGILNSKAY